MQANIGVRRSLVQEASKPWECAGPKAEGWLIKERMVDLALLPASSGLVGFLVFAMYRAMETWAVAGPAVVVVSSF